MSDQRLRQSYDRLLSIRAASSSDRAQCPTLEAMASLILRQGGEEVRLELLDHVMSCPFCEAEFSLLRAARLAGGDGEGPDPGSDPASVPPPT